MLGYFVGSFGSVVFIVGLASWSIGVTLTGVAITMLGSWLFVI